MIKRRYAALLPVLVLLSACSSKPKTTTEPAAANTVGTPQGGFLLQPQHDVYLSSGDFANNPAAEKFIDMMVSKHGFNRQQLQEVLSGETAGLGPAADGPAGADNAAAVGSKRRVATLSR